MARNLNMGTPDLILDTALRLFNETGCPDVSTNLIATEADISAGNLYYHFHNKADIVLTLLARYEQAVEPLLDPPDAQGMDIEQWSMHLHVFMETLYAYRFLYRDQRYVLSLAPAIERHFHRLLARQRLATSGVIEALARAGVIHADTASRGALADQIDLILNYWLAFEGSRRGHVDPAKAMIHAVIQIMLLMLPYLDEPSRAMVQPLIWQYQLAG